MQSFQLTANVDNLLAHLKPTTIQRVEPTLHTWVFQLREEMPKISNHTYRQTYRKNLQNDLSNTNATTRDSVDNYNIQEWESLDTMWVC